MPTPIIKSFEEKSQALADELAVEVLAAQDASIAEHGSFYVAVSGGSLVSTLEKAMIGQPGVVWNKWKIFFADERVVPLDDADSNYGLLKTNFLDKLAANTKTGVPTVYAIDPSLSPSFAVAASYAATLAASLPAVKNNTLSVPRFDLILLGCGPDGHTCSLFPGHPLNNVNDLTVTSLDDSPKPPPSRITITMPVLKAAEKIIFVAEGSGKQEAMHRIFVDNDQPQLPSAVVNATAKNPVTWIVSSSAISNIDIARFEAKSTQSPL